MSEPTTPTGKRLWPKVRKGQAHVDRSDILAIEAEAREQAGAERAEWQDIANGLAEAPEHPTPCDCYEGFTCIRCATLARYRELQAAPREER